MSRKEALNTFSDGLIKDLNPINTPHTVLTDCLNGTLITYNGNEFSLQNDMGNFPLKDCKLKENYVPVGVKEFGDILYIVSYNPLDEKVEIGSYPSPKTITHSTDKDSTVIINKDDTKYVFYGDDPENYKLNPGDQYRIDISNVAKADYQELKFYIFDENRKSYDITDRVINSVSYAYVSWDIPGWLAIQRRNAEINDFNINIKKLKVSPYSNSSWELKFNFQVSTDDKLITNASNNNLKIKIEYKINNANRPVVIADTKLNLKNGNTIYYTTDILYPNKSNASSLEIEATPCLYDGETKVITFDKFKKTYTFDFSKKGEISDINIGSTEWRYITDSEGLTFDLFFDTTGLNNSAVLEQDVFLYYSIQRIDNRYVTDNSDNAYTRIPCSDWSVIGETALSFKLENFTDNFNSKPNRFYAEDFYIMTFELFDTNNIQNTSPIKTIRKFITASELMNGQQNPLYDTIKFDDWISKYKNFIKNGKIIITNNTNSPTWEYSTSIKNNWAYNIWKGKGASDKYSTFVTDKDFSEGEMDKGFDIECEGECEIETDFGSDVELPKGPLWYYLYDDNNTVVEYSNLDTGEINPLTGKIDMIEDKEFTVTKDCLIPYTFEAETPIISVWDYSKDPLVYSTYSTTMTSNFKAIDGDNGECSITMSSVVPDANISKDTYSVLVDFSISPWYSTKIEPFLANLSTKFNKNDVLLVVVNLGVNNNIDSYSDSRIETHYNRSHTQYAKSTANLKTGYFAAFKYNEGTIALIPLYKYNIYTDVAKTLNDASTDLSTFLSKISRLKCKPNTYRQGIFYKASEGTETVSDTILSVSGTIKFGNILYKDDSENNYNLSNQSGRNDFKNCYINGQNIDFSNLIGTTYSIESFELEKNDLINVGGFDVSGISAITAIESEIQTFNSVCDTNRNTYSQDPILHDPDITKDTDRYIKSSNSVVVSEAMLNLLNKQILIHETPVYVEISHHHYGNEAYLDWYLGHTSTDDGYIITTNN